MSSDEPERREGLEPAEEARLRENLRSHFETASEEVDRDDVAYVLKKLDAKVERIGGQAVEQIETMLRQATLLGRMLKDWFQGNYEAPWRVVAAVTAALLYFINPMDVLPDVIPLIGYLDDIMVVQFCVRRIQEDLRKYARVQGLDLQEFGLDEEP